MMTWAQMVVTIITSIIASSSFWVFLQKRCEKIDAKTEMLIGLGHDRIVYLGLKYIERKSITQDEYENLYTFLFTPYKKLGGNGSADRIMREVDKLQITKGVVLNV